MPWMQPARSRPWLRKTSLNGELGDLTIRVKLDPETRTLTISDAGIGMTAEEIDKYINQIAFSGAEEFLAKYQNQSIIGHFGLGFYSAFMVSDKVEIITRSYREGSKTMKWSCDGTPEYTMEEAAETRQRGTDIILHLSEDCKEFAEKDRIRGILNKYCRFLPVPIAFGTKQEWKDGKYVDTIRTISSTIPNRCGRANRRTLPRTVCRILPQALSAGRRSAVLYPSE